MSTPQRTPRSFLLAVSAALGALVLGVLAPVALAPGASAHHAGAAPGPVNAGNTYGWWHHDGVGWMEHWETGRLAKYWDVRGRGAVQHQVGMLTLNTSGNGSVSATRKQAASTYGRWEIRLRTRRYETGGTDYRVLTELVPADPRAYRCGASNIALQALRPDSRRARVYARSDDKQVFRSSYPVNSRNQRWHTFAVEVTPRRIAWFVDAHVVRTETRAAARTGVPMTVRFTMQAVPGKEMNRSRMQMDWMRHFNLNAPNERPTQAPSTRVARYARGC